MRGMMHSRRVAKCIIRLSRARRVVENAFGILVTKWRIFRQPIIAKTSTVDDIVRASCVLHNFLRRRDGVSNDRRYIEVNDVDHDDRDGNVVPGPWRAHGEAMGLRDAGRLAANTYTRAAASARDKFADMICILGDPHIHRGFSYTASI